MAGEGERTSPPPLCSLQVQRAPRPGEPRRMPTRGWCGRAWGCRPRVGRERGRGPRPRRRVEKVCRQLVGSWSDVDRKCIGRRAHGSEVARKLVESPLGGGPMDRKSPGSWSEVRRRGLGSSGGSEVWPEVGRKLVGSWRGPTGRKLGSWSGVCAGGQTHGSEVARKLDGSAPEGIGWVGCFSEVVGSRPEVRRKAGPRAGSCSEVSRKCAPGGGPLADQGSPAPHGPALMDGGNTHHAQA